MSSILGTLWFVLLVGVCSFAAGVVFRPYVCRWLPGAGCKKG